VDSLSNEDDYFRENKQEGKRTYSEMRTKSKFPHVEKVFIARMFILLASCTTHDGEDTTTKWVALVRVRLLRPACLFVLPVVVDVMNVRHF